jgi:hypothetical protein
MTRDQVLELARRAPKIGSVAHDEFVDYVVALQQRKRGEDGWTTVEHPYMTVDGKLAMANEDHRRQGKRLDFDTPQVLVDNEDQLTLLVTITSEIYGTRHGIATSRRSGGSAAEREFPWEVAETSAMGRALSAMGYGLFPGSGLASAEDMLRVEGVERRGSPDGENRPAERRPSNAQSAQRSGYTRPQPPISPVQKRKLAELWRTLHGGSEGEAGEALDRLFSESFHHGMGEATYEEGARVTAQLLAELRTRAG